MKTIKHLLLLALVTTFAFSCKNKNAEVKTVEVDTTQASTNELDPNATYAKAEFTIKGMTCAMGCAATIQKKISKMDGVKSATVDFEKELAMVEYDEAKVNPTSLEETVVGVSDTYSVTDMKTVENFATKTACKPGCEKDCCKNGVKAGEKMACKADCKEACCANKTKTACEPGCEKDCCKAGIKEGEKMACKADCKEACCKEKAA
ncbi:heavy metal-associated domain-containing protein [Tamlana sp. 2_MG-2023]|uniref:heavy-metal-associated domain-containing protein n=1 Tax=unclassified Tamlana TaxID=2614803 RepID=UPI0026E42976|nr:MULTISPECIES: heavy metal-associated domain-containing protein [unclassified Tamlana]MDO6760577.1 heavy metal-associated domain-containing protein [Tamlana sp. 2_MG-2023]MDO6790833.1 heavy metal-associated domain-containing protein [Tamlana sp. 1_MG-2023]